MIDAPSWFYDILGNPKRIDQLPGPLLSDNLKELCSAQDKDFVKVLWNVLVRGCWIVVDDVSRCILPGQIGLGTETNIVHGPVQPCDLVVIGKHPGRYEHESGKIFSGYIGEELEKIIKENKLSNIFEKAYLTNLCKFYPTDKVLKKKWIHVCEWLLWAELFILHPKFVLLLGSEVLKHFFGPRATISKYRGAFIPYDLDQLSLKNPKISSKVKFQVFCTLNPGVVKDPGLKAYLTSDLLRFHTIYREIKEKKIEIHYLDDNGKVKDECILDTLDKVKKFVDERVSEDTKIFAVDCEWAGKSPHSDGKLLTIQISWAPGKAVLIPINKQLEVNKDVFDESLLKKFNEITSLIRQEFYKQLSDKPKVTKKLPNPMIPTSAGVLTKLPLKDNLFQYLLVTEEKSYLLGELEPTFSKKELQEVVNLLNSLFGREGVKVGGHSFRNDYAWLKALGLNLVEPYLNGFDTILMHHCLYESSLQDLTSIMMKYTSLKRYDMEVSNWINLTNTANTSGFGLIPEAILYPYALCDADATFRIYQVLKDKLEEEEKVRRGVKRLYDITLKASVAIIEMEENGILVDKDRLLYLAKIYKEKLEELEKEFKKLINWPDFNFRSVFHVRELLFGEELNGKIDSTNRSSPIRLRPRGAHCCNLTPIKTTDKPPKPWHVVEAYGESKATPAVDKEVLGILAEEDEVANKLRQLRFLDQVCKMYVALPDEEGKVTKGLLQHIDSDGRIRTSIIQTLETGRWASRNPNLQNLPKRREPELHNLFKGEIRPYKIRSIFKASPNHVLIEADFEQAELVVLALLSGDTNFWRALTDKKEIFVLCNKEGQVKYWLHPDWVNDLPNIKEGDFIPVKTYFCSYYSDSELVPLVIDEDCHVEKRYWTRDLHAERAISGFRLDYNPVLHGPARAYVKANCPHLRVAAKTVNFGIPYGRGARAISRELSQEGVKVTVEECQAVIDSFYKDFPDVKRFLDICKYNARTLGYIVTPFGRCRHFSTIDDEGLMLTQEREACNFPIQGTVADCLNQAAYNLWLAKRLAPKRGVDVYYRLLLGVHDALLLETMPAYLKPLIEPDGIIDTCMGKLASIPYPDKRICNGLYSRVDPDKFPFALSVDKSVSLRWDETPTKEELLEVGVPKELIDHGLV